MHSLKKYITWPNCLLTVITVIAVLAHGYNMFGFPYFENDEGTYMAQAWAIVRKGSLAPYTYWYDHAPGGWMLIALWVTLTGGFYTFGASVDSGRVFMLLMHLGSLVLLWKIARKLTGSVAAGCVAGLLFSVSPIAIYFQRRVLLDNMMVFWTLLALWVLLRDTVRLRMATLSALLFGFAVLTKENAIFFAPAFAAVLLRGSKRFNRRFVIILWATISLSVISLYVLYAILKQEFFPVGTFGDIAPHVSMIISLRDQLGRGSGLPFWNPGSEFYITFWKWFDRDAAFVLTAIVAIPLGMLVSIFSKAARIPTLFASLFAFFLLRGGMIIDFYILPLIPFVSLLTGVLVEEVCARISARRRILFYVAVACVGVFIACYQLTRDIGQFSRNETASQRSTISWIRQNAQANDKIVIDQSIYVDLHEPRFLGDRVFPNADWAWKVEKDPEILGGKLEGKWANVTYIALSHEMYRQIRDYNAKFLEKALLNSSEVVSWREGMTAFIDDEKFISTNGDWMSIYKVHDQDRIALENTWKNYKANFIHSYGQIIDPTLGNTTSEGQSYAMLRSVWVGDKVTFDNVWSWTRDHMQYRGRDKLFSWLWKGDDRVGSVADSANATDGDTDIALALLLAYGRWGQEGYLASAREIITDLWKYTVVVVDGKYVVMGGRELVRDVGYLVNPSYLSPATYKLFAEVDKSHPWQQVAADSYELLRDIGSLRHNKTYLPTNWVIVDKDSGDIRSADFYMGRESNYFGFDAFRVMWRIALDAAWFDSPDAKDYLSRVGKFYEHEWTSHGEIRSVYGLDGTAVSDYGSLSTTTGALSALTIVNPSLAREVYSKQYAPSGGPDITSWGDPRNYYEQNWAWFGFALHTGNLLNYFHMISQKPVSLGSVSTLGLN